MILRLELFFFSSCFLAVAQTDSVYQSETEAVRLSSKGQNEVSRPHFFTGSLSSLAECLCIFFFKTVTFFFLISQNANKARPVCNFFDGTDTKEECHAARLPAALLSEH